MIKYCYNEPVFDGVTLIGNEVVEMTRDQVLEYYWGYWKSQMDAKLGEGHPDTNEENCLEDFLIGHWGWTKET